MRSSAQETSSGPLQKNPLISIISSVDPYLKLHLHRPTPPIYTIQKKKKTSTNIRLRSSVSFSTHTRSGAARLCRFAFRWNHAQQFEHVAPGQCHVQLNDRLRSGVPTVDAPFGRQPAAETTTCVDCRHRSVGGPQRRFVLAAARDREGERDSTTYPWIALIVPTHSHKHPQPTIITISMFPLFLLTKNHFLVQISQSARNPSVQDPSIPPLIVCKLH